MELDTAGSKLLTFLVDLLPTIDPLNPKDMPGYREIHEKLQLPRVLENWGDSLKRNGLNNLADWTRAEGHPAITGIIVNQSQTSDHYLSPGGGYFRLFERKEDDWDWWRDQVREAIAYDWSRWTVPAQARPRHRVKLPPKANDLDVPPEREIVSISRVIRDTKKSLYVKHLHDYACQICGQTIDLGKGAKYAEAHHLRPLGKPHDGPDSLSNIVCVCPNHHAELDYRTGLISKDQFRAVPGHEIGDEYIAYHNANLRNAASGKMPDDDETNHASEAAVD